MTEEPFTLEADDPPKSGEWVDVHDVIENPTADELEAGRRDGESVSDGDDDA